METKEYFLRYVGKPDFEARRDPVNYLANYLTEIGMEGIETSARKEIRVEVPSYGRKDVVITRKDFKITSRGPNRLEIEAETLDEVEEGRKFIVGITHTHNFRDYLLDEVSEVMEATH